MFDCIGRPRRASLCFGIVASLLACVPQPMQSDDAPNAGIDHAIVRALEFLAREQKSSGAWATDSFGESTAATSLAVMAFLAAGHMPGEGPYGQQINRGIRWVIEHQEASGMIVHRKSHGPMYSHGISTLMLAEVYGMVDESLATDVRKALEQGIALILKSQAVDKHERHRGGWRYQIDSKDSDLSVTGWQVMALRAAKNIGCDVPAEAIDDAVGYIKRCASIRGGAPDFQGFGYQPGNGATATLTGVGILALEVCGEHQTPEAMGGAEYLLSRPLKPGSNYYFYGVYYTNVGMFKIGGAYADLTRAHTAEMLLSAQQPDGSWISGHSTERSVGPVYSTSLAILALAVDYRYLPIYQR
ncbi:MAG: terpene cyclase/mutase family protein [Planctomycetaceae bacterium]|nr:terpene cyclase/mutase family protein [Planctomycetaceae bacterium]